MRRTAEAAFFWTSELTFHYCQAVLKLRRGVLSPKTSSLDSVMRQLATSRKAHGIPAPTHPDYGVGPILQSDGSPEAALTLAFVLQLPPLFPPNSQKRRQARIQYTDPLLLRKMSFSQV